MVVVVEVVVVVVVVVVLVFVAVIVVVVIVVVVVVLLVLVVFVTVVVVVVAMVADVEKPIGGAEPRLLEVPQSLREHALDARRFEAPSQYMQTSGVLELPEGRLRPKKLQGVCMQRLRKNLWVLEVRQTRCGQLQYRENFFVGVRSMQDDAEMRRMPGGLPKRSLDEEGT